jgi:hypothetical protein
MTLSRESKFGLAVAGSFLCLVGAVLAAQLFKSTPESPKQDAPAVGSITSVAKVKSTPEVPAPPPTMTEPPLANSGRNSNDGVFGSVILKEKITSPPRVEEVVNASENLRQLQSEYRRFWDKNQTPRVTAIQLPQGFPAPVQMPNAAVPAPRLTTPLGSTQNPWDVSRATPAHDDVPQFTFSPYLYR